MSAGQCELCGREVPKRTRHHLIPRTRHKSRSALKRWTKHEMTTSIAMLCTPCHKQIHAVIDEKTMEREYHSLQLLASHPEVARFLEWIKSKPGDCRVVVRRQRPKR